MARSFNGSTQYATATSSTIYNSTDITISAWLKVDASAGGIDHAVGAGGDSGSVLDGWGIEVNTFNGLSGTIWDADAYATQAGSYYAYTAGVWTHAALVCRLTTSELNQFYGGGSQSGSDLTSGGRAANSQQFRLAVNTALTGNFFFGEIAEVSIFNTNLGSSAISSLAGGSSPLAVAPANCVAYWRMDGSGSTEADLVSGITLTYVASPGSTTGPTVDDPPASGSILPLLNAYYS